MFEPGELQHHCNLGIKSTNMANTTRQQPTKPNHCQSNDMIEQKQVFKRIRVTMSPASLMITIIVATATTLVQATLMPKYQLTQYRTLDQVNNNDNNNNVMIGKLSDDSSVRARHYNHYQVAENDLQLPEPQKELQATINNKPISSGHRQQQLASTGLIADRTVINGNHATYIEPPADFKPIIYETVQANNNNNNLNQNLFQPAESASVGLVDSELIESPNQLINVQPQNASAIANNNQPNQFNNHNNQQQLSSQNPPRRWADSATLPSSATLLLASGTSQPTIASSSSSNRAPIQQQTNAANPTESTETNENDANGGFNNNEDDEPHKQGGGQHHQQHQVDPASQLKAPIGRWSDWHDISFEPDLASSDSHLSQSSAPSNGLHSPARPIGSSSSSSSSPILPSAVAASVLSPAQEGAGGGRNSQPQDPNPADQQPNHNNHNQPHLARYSWAGRQSLAGGMIPSRGSLIFVPDPYQRNPLAFPMQQHHQGPVQMRLMGPQRQAAVVAALQTGRQLTGAGQGPGSLAPPQPQVAGLRQLAANYAAAGGSFGCQSDAAGSRMEASAADLITGAIPFDRLRAGRMAEHRPQPPPYRETTHSGLAGPGRSLKPVHVFSKRRVGATEAEQQLFRDLLLGGPDRSRLRRNSRANAEVYAIQRRQQLKAGQLVVAGQPGQLQQARAEPEPQMRSANVNQVDRQQQQQQHHLVALVPRLANQVASKPATIVRRQATQPSVVVVVQSAGTNSSSATTSAKRSSSNSATKAKSKPNLRTQLPVGLSSWILGGIRDLDGRHWQLPAELMSKLAINDVDLNHSFVSRQNQTAPSEQPEVATNPPPSQFGAGQPVAAGAAGNQPRVPR